MNRQIHNDECSEGSDPPVGRRKQRWLSLTAGWIIYYSSVILIIHRIGIGFYLNMGQHRVPAAVALGVRPAARLAGSWQALAFLYCLGLILILRGYWCHPRWGRFTTRRLMGAAAIVAILFGAFRLLAGSPVMVIWAIILATGFLLGPVILFGLATLGWFGLWLPPPRAEVESQGEGRSADPEVSSRRRPAG